VSRQALPPAVVIGGNANAVSVARSLGRRGVDVTVYGDRHGHVRYSRFCAEYVDVGGGPGVADRWLGHLLDRPLEAVLLPCDDEALTLIAQNRESLTRAGYQPFEADDDVVLRMLDKARTYELAAAAGIPVPMTIPLVDADAVERAIDEIGAPCALKPVSSHAFARIYRNRKAFVVDSASELRRRWAEASERGLAMVATEIIPGPDDRLCSYYAYIDETGRTLVGLTKRKVRQYPSGFGLGSFEVTDHAPDVREAGARFFAAAGIRGLANVEFKRDARDGTLRLIECNHRFTASNELVRVAGIDLAWLAYARLSGAPLPPLDRYRDGVTLWNPLRDLRGIAIATRRGEARVADWLPGLVRRHVLPVFQWDDPAPTVAYHAAMFARIPAKLGEGRRATSRAVSAS
jgi:D-aspartate ligase